jgi:hypothetical protein
MQTNLAAEDIYWTDGSYIEVAESEATKVSYHVSGNHSAVRLDNNWYKSKWGDGPLVKHHPNDIPLNYSPSSPKKYYKKAPLSISGPDFICNSNNVVFKVINPPSPFTWSCSTNFTLVSTSNNAATFSRNGNSTGSGWVRVMSNGVEVTRKNVWIGPIPVASITGPTYHPAGQFADFQAVFASGSPSSNLSYEWTIVPNNSNIIWGSDSESSVLSVAINSPGSYQIKCRTYNSCGWSDYRDMTVQIYSLSTSYATAYPVPASGSLTVSFNAELVAQTQSALQSASSLSATIGTAFSLSLKLYDRFGVLQRQTASSGEDVTLDVSSLASGIYFLHVHDGISDAPEVHKIIVQH